MVDPLSALLVKAVVRGDRDAWRAWSQRRRGTSPPLRERRILTLAYPLLREWQERESEWFPLAAGLYRESWQRTELIFVRLREALGVLQERGIDSLLLKGTAVASAFYSDRGLRTMSDFDLLLRESDLAPAVRALEGVGWAPMSQVPPELTRRHDFTLAHRSGGECDLHRRLYPSAPAELTEFLFGASVSIVVGGIEARRPCDADLLLHAVVHGVLMNRSDDLQWLADGARIVDAGVVDWERLIRAAREQRLSHALAAGLGTIRDLTAAGIPQRVIETMEAEHDRDLPVRGEHRARQFGRMIRAGGLRGAVAFCRMLQEDWGVSAATLPAEVLRKIARGRRPDPRTADH